jgi:hypothetical protein
MGPGMDWGNPDMSNIDWDKVGPALAILFGFIVAWLAMCSVTGWLAVRKGGDGGFWFVLAFFLGPFALLAIVLRPAVRSSGTDVHPGEGAGRG